METEPDELKKSINKHDRNNFSVLHYASQSGNTAVVNLLLEKGAGEILIELNWIECINSLSTLFKHLFILVHLGIHLSITLFCLNDVLYSASQKKGKPINQVNFSENCNDLSEFLFTLLQNTVYPLSFDTSYKMYWPCMV